MNQYPSPMADTVRAHQRIENKKLPGLTFHVENVLSKPVNVYIPERDNKSPQVDLLIHFHGANFILEHAVYHSNHPFALAVVNLGSGSSVYENPFQNKSTFSELIDSVKNSISQKKSVETEFSQIYLSSFSAGYGAVRTILKNHQSAIDGIILLDGLHTGYIPPRRVLAKGGTLDEEKLKDFLQFAKLAADGKKVFLITHSEIFPGTYASTTETADYIINKLSLQRNPVLEWGPVGMQLLSETSTGGLTILGFAGNSAPDHIDHFHGLPHFLKMILDEKPVEN